MFTAALFPLIGRLIVVIDAPGNIPLFIAALRGVPGHRGQRVILREMLVALILMGGFALFGAKALAALGIELNTVGVSGGIILFLMALRMLFPQTQGPLIASRSGEPFIFPLAVPLVAGPSVLAVLIDWSRVHPPGLLAMALLGAWAISTIILLAADPIKRALGDDGLSACERIMGFILLLLASEMILTGTHAYLTSPA